MTVQLATKINEKVKKTLELVCESRGLKMNRFIEEAIIDKLEELEDSEELKALRKEKTKPLKDILKNLK